MENILSRVNSPGDLKALSKEEILGLAEEIRAFLCEKVQKSGGHLASNLGIVELTIAIHRIFDSPKDHVLFDVGHQSYVHKILTGRKDAFDHLREPGCLSGFTKRSESEHDPFGAGHSSTSLSAGLGFAEADRLLGSDAYTVVVLGDGAYTGGMIHEGLNNIRENCRLILILNENEMSISHTSGAFASLMTKLRSSKNYYPAKRRFSGFLTRIPVIGKCLYKGSSHLKAIFKRAVYGANYFEELGLRYLGPVDGNDEERVERLLEEAKLLEKPAIIHVKTKKGKGFAPAENNPSHYHGIPPAGCPSFAGFSTEMGLALCELAQKDTKICAVTAAMADGTGLIPFKEQFPERFFDVGIAEEHAVTFSAGLAAQKLLPVFAVYSTFLQRAYDNILHDLSLQGLPLTVCVDRASLACSDGATHHGIYDVALMNAIPGSVIYAPATFESLRSILREAIYSPGLKIIRYPNSGELPVSGLKRGKYLYYDFPDGCKSVVVTYGKEAKEVLKAREKKALGIVILEKLSPYEETAANIRAVLPSGIEQILFAEEGALHGGAGEAFQTYFKDFRYDILAISSHGLGEKDRDYYSSCGIGAEDILQAAETA